MIATYYTEPIIECENVIKIYAPKNTNKSKDLETIALQGVNLQIYRGEVVGIVGESGSGKSTLLSLLGQNASPTAGKVIITGRNTSIMEDTERNRLRLKTIGRIWQQPSKNLVPYLSAVENVQLAIKFSNEGKNEQRKRAEELIALVGLSHRASHLPVELSGGEQQRVAIAIAMANRPKIILADEPTGELDTETAVDIYYQLDRIRKEFGTTVLIVSHDSDIHNYVDRILNVSDGIITDKENPDATSNRLVPVQEKHDFFCDVDADGHIELPQTFFDHVGSVRKFRISIQDNALTMTPVEYVDDPSPNEELPGQNGKKRSIRTFLRKRSRK